MAASKLFTPVLSAKGAAALSASEREDMFYSPPTHADGIPQGGGNTDSGGCPHPLKMGKGSQRYAKEPQKRGFASKSDKGTY